MAICRTYGYPDLFITFTCNPKWPEIARCLADENLKPEDRPDIIVRMFKIKLDILTDELRNERIFGGVIASTYTIEFQKRGLPHAHILLFLEKEDKYPTGEDIDIIISAEIPDEKTDSEYYAAVQKHMIHGPCGHSNPKSPCMANSKCTKHFPKAFVDRTNVDQDGYPIYRRRENGRIIMKNGVPVDNRWIVPHNRELLIRYGGHINVEWCNQARSIKYLFKYVNKGSDRVTANFYRKSNDGDKGKNFDEVEDFYDCRYISPCEAAWRLFKYEIQFKDPPVVRLPFHLPNQKSVVFADGDSLEDVQQRALVNESMFEAWFTANKDYPKIGADLTYVEFPMYFVWNQTNREWTPRNRGRSIGRLYYVSPGSGEAYYLRLLLNVRKGCKSFNEIMYTNKTQHKTFRDACYSLGLLDDDKEYIEGIKEASAWATGYQLRALFATLLSTDCMSRPEEVWEKSWVLLSEDIKIRYNETMNTNDLELSEADLKNRCLLGIDAILQSRGKRITDYTTMPAPTEDSNSCRINRFIAEEMQYNKIEEVREFDRLIKLLNEEQRAVYNNVMDAVYEKQGGFFFVYGYGGTGKTLIWKTLSSSIRSKGDIVLNVASSGIASLLLPGGRTAHSRFKIPLILNEDSMCKIYVSSPLAQLLVKSKLIIWDEAPMMHKHCFESLDRTLKDIMKTENPGKQNAYFGGKVVVLGGDFRQILPVVPKGSRQDIVNASINSSYLWSSCTVLRLTKNMRLQHCKTSIDVQKMKEFADWIASIGDGTIGPENEGTVEIEIPEDILLEGGEDPIGAIVASTYPQFRATSNDASYLDGRAILAPTLDMVDEINEHMIKMNKMDETIYLSSDGRCKSDAGMDLLEDIHTPEFLNSLKISGLPNHKLLLKIGTPIMLLRNIDHSLGLCNGTRLVITSLAPHVIEGRILGGINAGHLVLIPRMTLTPSNTSLPFKFQRRQFPVIVSYAMTINKSQGQSLTNVGLYLRKPVFSHGQLYVVVSRVTNRDGLKILACDSNGRTTTVADNVVYREVFQNL